MADKFICTAPYRRGIIIALLEGTHVWPNWSFVDQAKDHLASCSSCQNEFVSARSQLNTIRRDLGRDTHTELSLLRNSYLAAKYAAEVAADLDSQSDLLAQLAAAGSQLETILWSINTSGVPYGVFSPFLFGTDDDDEGTEAIVGAYDFLASLSQEDLEFVMAATSASRAFPSPSDSTNPDLIAINKEEDWAKRELLLYQWAVEHSEISPTFVRVILEVGAGNIAEEYLRKARSHPLRHQPPAVDCFEATAERAAFDELRTELLRDFEDFRDSMKAGQMELIRLAEEKESRANSSNGDESICTSLDVELPDSLFCTEAKEQHYRIQNGAKGFSYETIFRPYLNGADEITVEDPYIRARHQIINFLRFCETVVKLAKPKKILLVTKLDDENEKNEVLTQLEKICLSLRNLEVELQIILNPNLHDRQVRLNNGWTIKIGRGFDIYQRPDEWLSVGANDLDLRPCRETTVDIFRTQSLT